ncbi:50S ribosomal protein L17 [Georgenia sp. Z1344]|uniref:50S ribosomal protein L17 n=1 Tax=Georgenia sp. Z1344 TaxID=3416706 RepID=UPI003CF7E7DF
MPKPAKGPRLGGSPSHERHMLDNLAQSLFEHGSITTTVVRAKRVQPLAERLVQFAKRGDLASRRRVLTHLSDKSVVHTLFAETAPKMADRDGGYTRITKVGNRKGDNAPMAVIELVLEPVSPKQAVVKEATKAAQKAAPAAEAPAAEDTSSGDTSSEETAVEVPTSAESIEADAGDTADVEAVEADAPAAEATEVDADEATDGEATDGEADADKA